MVSTACTIACSRSLIASRRGTGFSKLSAPKPTTTELTAPMGKAATAKLSAPKPTTAKVPATEGASGYVIIPSPKVFVRGIFARRATVVFSPTATDERMSRCTRTGHVAN
jgi:hypothetical protein